MLPRPGDLLLDAFKNINCRGSMTFQIWDVRISSVLHHEPVDSDLDT